MVRTLPSHLVLAGMEYHPSASCAGRMGCGGEETLYLKAVKPGSGDLVLKYGRPFEALPTKSTIKTISVEPSSKP